jgi:hypothetical protein
MQRLAASVASTNTSANNDQGHRTINLDVRHRRNMRWDELAEPDRHRIARGWSLDPHDPGDVNAATGFFNHSSPGNRWHYICASERADGSYEAELRRIAENTDPATTEAFAGREE